MQIPVFLLFKEMYMGTWHTVQLTYIILYYVLLGACTMTHINFFTVYLNIATHYIDIEFPSGQ